MSEHSRIETLLEELKSFAVLKEEIERTLALYRDVPPPNVSDLMQSIKNSIKDLDDKLCVKIKSDAEFRKELQPIIDLYQRGGWLARVVQEGLKWVVLIGAALAAFKGYLWIGR